MTDATLPCAPLPGSRGELLHGLTSMMLYKLRDFDWSQRLVLSSDKLSLLRRPVLLLKLDLVDDDGAAKEVLLEFEEHELKDFVRELGNAHEALRTLVDV